MKASLLHAFKWSAAAEIASKAIQPIIFIIVARLLTPTDYGIVAAALMVISFTQIFWEAGMSKAIIQRQSHIREAANIGFWINISVGLLVAIVLFVCSDLIAESIFHEQKIAAVLKVMTAQVFLGALSSIQTALMQREMKFKQLFWIRIITVMVPGLFSIPLAWYGFSYWALVIGTLAGQTLQVIVLWILSEWKPALEFNMSVARDLIRFAFWVGFTGLLVWFYLWADSLIVGSYLGTDELGLFRTANTFVLMIFDSLLFGPILPVLYSYFSGLDADRTRIGAACLKVIRLIAIISIPVAIVLFSVAEPMSFVIFGEKWSGIGFVIGILAIMRGYGWLVGINGEAYRAIGRPYYETIVYAISCTFFLAGYLISIRYGFQIFIYTRLMLGMLSLLPHFYLFRKLFGFPLWSMAKTVVGCTVISCLSLLVVNIVPKFDSLYLYLLIVLSITGIVVFGLIYLFERKFITSIFNDHFSNFRFRKSREPEIIKKA